MGPDADPADPCALPTVWRTDVKLESWMIPLMADLVRIEGNLWVDENTNGLRGLSGAFPNLVNVTGHVRIYNSPLEELNGFESLEEIGEYLEISSNCKYRDMFPPESPSKQQQHAWHP